MIRQLLGPRVAHNPKGVRKVGRVNWGSVLRSKGKISKGGLQRGAGGFHIKVCIRHKEGSQQMGLATSLPNRELTKLL